jgi:3-deoxy-manno-octulosonate cytidylyltransferase (CMP-KDO synthetase)
MMDAEQILTHFFSDTRFPRVKPFGQKLPPLRSQRLCAIFSELPQFMSKKSPVKQKDKKASTVALVIPARWGSTRFPGKPLHLLAGKPLLQHVWERSLQARHIARVLIATDDTRIAEAARAFGAEVVMTSPDHPSGTDRIAEVAARLRGLTHFINVQGDEPLIDPLLIESLAGTLLKNPEIAMITAATPFENLREANNPNTVKVVVARTGDALYFSRSRIPFHREAHDPASSASPLLHLGIYGYRRDTLRTLVRLSPTPLEACEKLEQLRALEHGIPIRVIQTAHRGVGVDTPQDARRVEKLLKAAAKSQKLTK